MVWGKNRGEFPAPGATTGAAGLGQLFLTFTLLGLASFGGSVPAWMHRAFVERRRRLGEAEFAAALALSRLMPGANVVNLAILIGHRLRRWPGAIAAALGLVTGPSVAVVALAVVYRRFAGSLLVEAALEGIAAAGVGLLIAMGVRSGRALIGSATSSPRHVFQVAGTILILIAAFVLIGVLRLPTVVTVLALVPVSVAFAYFTRAAPPVDNG
jgi:chromate transporter